MGEQDRCHAAVGAAALAAGPNFRPWLTACTRRLSAISQLSTKYLICNRAAVFSRLRATKSLM